MYVTLRVFPAAISDTIPPGKYNYWRSTHVLIGGTAHSMSAKMWMRHRSNQLDTRSTPRGLLLAATGTLCRQRGAKQTLTAAFLIPSSVSTAGLPLTSYIRACLIAKQRRGFPNGGRSHDACARAGACPSVLPLQRLHWPYYWHGDGTPFRIEAQVGALLAWSECSYLEHKAN